MGRKEEEEKLPSKWYIYQRGWLKFFFMIFGFFFLWFWFLVFNCRVTRVARGVLLWTLGWVGVHYTTWGKFIVKRFFPSTDWTTGTCYLLTY